MRVIATSYLTDSSKSYRPGDEIKDGELFKQAAYYAKIGKVRIDDGEPTPIVTQQATWQSADQEATFKNALDKVAVTNTLPNQAATNPLPDQVATNTLPNQEVTQNAENAENAANDSHYLDQDDASSDRYLETDQPFVTPEQRNLTSASRGRPKKA